MILRPDWDAINTISSVIGAIATIAIGWAAFGISKTQAKAALFDRRFKAYRDLAAGISSMTIEGAIHTPTFNTIKEAVHLARFLYDGQTVSLLEKIQSHAYRAWMKRPLENRVRSIEEYDKSEFHMSEIDRLWSEAEPKMEQSLRTWVRDD